MTMPGQGFMPLYIDELVRLEGPADDRLCAGARRFVGVRVAATSGVTRIGLRVAEAVADLWVRAGSGGRSLGDLDAAERARWARRLAASGLPLIADWSRMVRSLVLAYVYEDRYGHAVEPGGLSAPAAPASAEAA